MAISTYSELVGHLTYKMNLTTEELTELPNLIALADAELARSILAPERETTATVATVAAVDYVALPTGFRQARSILIDDDYPLAPVALNDVLAGNSDGTSGKPQKYTIARGRIYLSPVPDAAYTLTIFHMAGITPLTATETTNWLITAHPDLYVYAVLYQIEIDRENDERAASARSVVDGIVAQINAQGNRYRNASPMRIRSPVVV